MSGGASGQANSTPGSAQPVAIVMLENTAYSSVIGNSATPFLNQLAQQNGLATNYFADTHPSIGNYFMITAGQVITNDDSFSGTVSADNLAREIVASGKTWKVYAQGLPTVGYTGGDQYPYLRHHNPFSYFSDVLSNTGQAKNMVPFNQLASDAGGSIPDFLFIVPDAQHDAHDCPAGMTTCSDNDKLSAADTWLQQNVAPLLNVSAFGNGVLIIVFDESAMTDTANGGGHVVAIVAGPSAKKAFQDGNFFQHQSLLRLICDRLKLGTCPGAGAGAPTAMSSFLQGH